jgi:hypothetical protein
MESGMCPVTLYNPSEEIRQHMSQEQAKSQLYHHDVSKKDLPSCHVLRSECVWYLFVGKLEENMLTGC